MLNALLSGAMLPPPVITEAPADNLAKEAKEQEIRAQAELEKQLAEEVGTLNGGGKPGEPAKPSNRVSPLL